MCPASPGGVNIVIISPFTRLAQGLCRSRRAVAALAFAVSACAVPGKPVTSSEGPSPTELVQSLPPAQQPGAPRTLAVLPKTSDEGAAAEPIIVRGAAAPAQTAPAAPTTVQGPADITLSFAGADIRDVVASVLGGTLKLNYVIDPDVTGPVSFTVSRPLRRDEVLPVLDEVLASRGFSMVQSDGIVRVMTTPGEGKSHAALPLAGPGTVGESLEVIPTRYVSAADLAAVVAKVLPPGRLIVPDEKRRLLLVQGSSEELKLVGDTVRVFDVDQLAGTSVAILPLKNADAATVILELQNIFEATRKDAEANEIRFFAVDRLNAVMILTRQQRYIDEARAWVARLDRTRNLNEQRVYVYYLQYGKAGQVAQTLQGALSGLNVEVKGGETASTEGLGAGTTGMPLPPVPPTATGFPTPPPLLGSAPAAPLQPVAAAAAQTPSANAQPSVKIEADEAHNALLISATPRDYTLIRQVLEGIDTPPLQVLIEVTIAEVELNDNLQYGVQYFLNTKGNASGNVSALLTTGSATTGIAPTTPGFSLSFTAANINPRIILNALSALTQTKVISTPRLMVLDNQTARLQVGDVVPIITQSAASTTTSSPLVLSNVEYKETGVVLEVTPRVNASGYVTLDINQSVSDVVPTTSSSINSPTFSQRRLASTISVKNGNAILLGGLIQKEDDRNAQGIPLLSDIPVLGALFGNRNDTAMRTELIMFMTPHVISNDDESNDITERVKQQFKAVLDQSDLAAPRPTPR